MKMYKIDYKIKKLSNYVGRIAKISLPYISIAVLFLVHMKLNFAAILYFFFSNVLVNNVYS